MIIRSQTNELVDTGGSLIRRAQYPLEVIELVTISSDTVETDFRKSVTLFQDTNPAPVNAKYAALIAALAGGADYFSMI
jgi:hypothetical protein